MQQKLDRLSADVRGLNDYCVSIDKRVLRVETMIEMSGRGSGQPRIGS